MTVPFDPERDLFFTRDVDVSVAFLWQGWTTPELLVKWFTPAPWVTTACTIDLRPGGLFHTVMQSPDGLAFPNDGCYLEVIDERRLVWTNAVGPGFRPQPPSVDEYGFGMTAIIELEPLAHGTRYKATVLHADAKTREKHASMGFETGWGAALDQLVALAPKS